MNSNLPQCQQAVRAQVEQPNGKVTDWVSPVVIADRKDVTVDVPVAYNYPRGSWTVSATELYTGKSTSAKFRVE